MTWLHETARLNDTADVVDADTVRERHSVDVGSVDSVARSHWPKRRSVYTHCEARPVAR